MASGRSQVELTEEGATTRLAYTVKASVGGKLGQIGGRMMDASAKQLADQFFAALREHLAPVAAAAPAVPAAAVSPRPAAAPQAPPPSAPVAGEASRLLWFSMGVAATGVGVWIGAKLF
jgi:hypothetical protein